MDGTRHNASRYLDGIRINRNSRRWIMKWQYKSYVNVNQIRDERRIVRVKSVRLFPNFNNSRRTKEARKGERGRAGRSEIGINERSAHEFTPDENFRRHRNQITWQDYFRCYCLLKSIGRAAATGDERNPFLQLFAFTDVNKRGRRYKGRGMKTGKRGEFEATSTESRGHAEVLKWGERGIVRESFHPPRSWKRRGFSRCKGFSQKKQKRARQKCRLCD